MKKPVILRTIFIIIFIGFCTPVFAQAKSLRMQEKSTIPIIKPFKVLTNGRQVTVQANQKLKSMMVWTASGHRIVELKEMDITRHTFIVPQKESIIFLLMEFADGKRYTEKMGIR